MSRVRGQVADLAADEGGGRGKGDVPGDDAAGGDGDRPGVTDVAGALYDTSSGPAGTPLIW